MLWNLPFTLAKVRAVLPNPLRSHPRGVRASVRWGSRKSLVSLHMRLSQKKLDQA